MLTDVVPKCMHVFSAWHYSPHPAYNSTVRWAGGEQATLYRRERPKLLFSAAGEIEYLYGNFDIILDQFSRFISPHATHHAPCGILHLVSRMIDGACCLQSDVMTNSRLPMLRDLGSTGRGRAMWARRTMTGRTVQCLRHQFNCAVTGL